MAHEKSAAQAEMDFLIESQSSSRRSDASSASRRDSSSTASTASLILENINANGTRPIKMKAYRDAEDEFDDPAEFHALHVEDGSYHPYNSRPADKRYKRWLYLVVSVAAAGWAAAFVLFLMSGSYKHRSTLAHDPSATISVGSGKKITLDQVEQGYWRPTSHNIEWINGSSGEDGMVLERGGENGRDWLVVENVRNRGQDDKSSEAITLMKHGRFNVGGEDIFPNLVWPSPDLKNVLVMSNRQHNWRHSYTGRYWVFNVDSQEARPLDPDFPDARVQLATWSPTSDAVVFTLDNNMFFRPVHTSDVDTKIVQLTTDGGVEMFNGVPDWVYEEEVFSGNSATWWSQDGKYIAYLATNETEVPEYPIEYFISRPSRTDPPPDEEAYPEVRKIKYPKAGAPIPIVHLRFVDMDKMEVFDVPIENDFPDNVRIITEVVWAGNNILIRELNRASTESKMILINVHSRTGKVVRNQHVDELEDGGWFEISETTTYVPKDPSSGRDDDGYIDTIIHEGYDHLAYFTPLDNPNPRVITSGKWEVVEAPSRVDLKKNYIYLIGTKDGSTQRHVYKVDLDGTGFEAVTDTSVDGYYEASFSISGSYALLSYKGPGIPWQKVISTASNDDKYSASIEKNEELANRAAIHELPIKIFSTINIDGYDLNVVERRPPHFSEKKKYPVLFYLYGGPNSQVVDKTFNVDFQSYVASSLGYIVVTVDGRGTGFLGRKTRCIVRNNLGYWESHDQIATAKEWASRPYVDPDRLAIWGWSYGGYMTLKTLEMDAGRTFKYGMAVAPVTDWRFYDAIYTERWMDTPQVNPQGYYNSSIHNITALAENVRFLLMHGVADDNVHFQNSLVLLDQLDIAGVENYDVHVFPDSDHGIMFDNAHRIVMDKLSWWIVNAFNGQWVEIQHPVPGDQARNSGNTG